jgi:hypothetical protein
MEQAAVHASHMRAHPEPAGSDESSETVTNPAQRRRKNHEQGRGDTALAE